MEHHHHHHHHETPEEMIRKAWAAFEQGDERDAYHWYGHVTAQELNDVAILQAYVYLALAFGDDQTGLTAINKALRLDGQQAQSWLLQGNALRRQEAFEKAIKSFKEVVRLEPENVDGWYNLGITHEDAQDYEAAEKALRAGLKAEPLDADLLNALGSVLDAMHQRTAAIGAYEQAIAVDPDFAPLKFNLAHALLADRQWQRGWEMYDARLQFRDTEKFPETDAAMWKGEPLAGKTILVWSEQGFGDTIQFVRYVRQLEDKGAKVVLRTQDAMVRLLEQNAFGEAVVGVSDGVPETDYEIPLLSLPRYLDMEHGFGIEPYITAGECFIPELREKQDVPHVGFVWAGNPKHPDDRRRSVPGRLLKDLIMPNRFRAVSLQVGKATQQLKHIDLLDTSEWLMEWTDTAAAIDQLDLVIAVDTAVAHLAGAMGKEVWLLLDAACDWRWAADADGNRPDWYLNIRYFQQEKAGDWEAVMARVRKALGSRF